MPATDCLHQIFEQHARRSPQDPAVSFGDQSLSYGELNARANRIARYLRGKGVGPESLVGICLERSLDLIAGILGILKAGAAYVPLDPAYPQERLEFLVADSGLSQILTSDKLAGELPIERVPCVIVERDIAAELPSHDLEPCASPENAAYVIYTSGSTGTPKGVVIEHRQVLRLFESTRHWFRFGAQDVWSLFHSFAFDFSVWEIWGALLHGGRLVVVPSTATRSPDAFYELLVRERVTVLNQTPSSFLQFARYESTRPDPHALALRHVIFGGESLAPELLRSWFERHGNERPRLINMYGITETTVHVTYCPIRSASVQPALGSPIGMPIPDLKVYVLDEHGKPVEQGLRGEMYVGGAGVARGYLNRPQLNADRFLPDPFQGGDARMYRSGDLAIETADGLWYVGRADDQLKVRGFRIEPAEIEHCLRSTTGLSDVAVVGRDHGDGDSFLVAYVVPLDSARASFVVEEARARALQMPEHMRPSRYVSLAKLPLNNNGKVDRAALRELGLEADGSAESASSPLEEALVGIWKETLRVDEIGVCDDFFDAGGTSLSAIRMVLMINERLGYDLDVAVLSQVATIRDLAGTIANRSAQ